MTKAEIELLVQVSQSKGTTVNHIPEKPCTTCGCEYFYKAGDTPRGHCFACQIERSRNGNPDNSPSTTPQKQEFMDSNFIKCVIGKECSRCGSNVRLAQSAYGAKASRCRECALEDLMDKATSKEITRLKSEAKKHAFLFEVRCIETAGTVEVATSNLTEWYEVQSLVAMRNLMNKQEQNLETGIVWEIGHKYPAAGTGVDDALRGKATLDNLFLISRKTNNAESNAKPDSWELNQVVNIREVELLGSANATEELNKRLGFDTITKVERNTRMLIERDKTNRMVKAVGEQLKADQVELAAIWSHWHGEFDRYLHMSQDRVNKQALKMNNLLKEYLEQYYGNGKAYARVGNDLLLEDVFMGTGAIWTTINHTLGKIEELRFKLLEEDEPSEVKLAMVETIKRCAVMWVEDVLKPSTVSIPAFTHPLLNAFIDEPCMGLYKGQDGKPWICSWAKENRFQLALDSTTAESRKFDAITGWIAGDEQYFTYNYRAKCIAARAEERAKLVAAKEAEKKAKALANAERWMELTKTKVEAAKAWLEGFDTALIKATSGLEFEYLNQVHNDDREWFQQQIVNAKVKQSARSWNLFEQAKESLYGAHGRIKSGDMSFKQGMELTNELLQGYAGDYEIVSLKQEELEQLMVKLFHYCKRRNELPW